MPVLVYNPLSPHPSPRNSSEGLCALLFIFICAVNCWFVAKRMFSVLPSLAGSAGHQFFIQAGFTYKIFLGRGKGMLEASSALSRGKGRGLVKKSARFLSLSTYGTISW